MAFNTLRIQNWRDDLIKFCRGLFLRVHPKGLRSPNLARRNVRLGLHTSYRHDPGVPRDEQT